MTPPTAELSGDAALEGPDRSSILANLTAMLPTAGLLMVVLTILCGVVYALTILTASQLLFPDQAAGSQVVRGGRIIGSRLIGQSFAAPDYFWGRPSATAPDPYNAAASGEPDCGPCRPYALICEASYKDIFIFDLEDIPR